MPPVSENISPPVREAAVDLELRRITKMDNSTSSNREGSDSPLAVSSALSKLEDEFGGLDISEKKNLRITKMDNSISSNREGSEAPSALSSLSSKLEVAFEVLDISGKKDLNIEVQNVNRKMDPEKFNLLSKDNDKPEVVKFVQNNFGPDNKSEVESNLDEKEKEPRLEKNTINSNSSKSSMEQLKEMCIHLFKWITLGRVLLRETQGTDTLRTRSPGQPERVEMQNPLDMQENCINIKNVQQCQRRLRHMLLKVEKGKDSPSDSPDLKILEISNAELQKLMEEVAFNAIRRDEFTTWFFSVHEADFKAFRERLNEEPIGLQEDADERMEGILETCDTSQYVPSGRIGPLSPQDSSNYSGSSPSSSTSSPYSGYNYDALSPAMNHVSNQVVPGDLPPHSPPSLYINSPTGDQLSPQSEFGNVYMGNENTSGIAMMNTPNITQSFGLEQWTHLSIVNTHSNNEHVQGELQPPSPTTSSYTNSSTGYQSPPQAEFDIRYVEKDNTPEISTWGITTASMTQNPHLERYIDFPVVNTGSNNEHFRNTFIGNPSFRQENSRSPFNLPEAHPNSIVPVPGQPLMVQTERPQPPRETQQSRMPQEQNNNIQGSYLTIMGWQGMQLPKTEATLMFIKQLNKYKIVRVMVPMKDRTLEELIQSDACGTTPLMRLVENSIVLEERKHELMPLVQLLKNHCPNALAAKNYNDEDALYLAAMMCPDLPYVTGYLAAEMILAGIDFRATYYRGVTLIQAVTMKGASHREVLKELLALETAERRPMFDESKTNYAGSVMQERYITGKHTY